MLTRGEVHHQYYPAPCTTVRTPGAVRVNSARPNMWTKQIPQVWPIMRPSTAPNPNGAPFYVTGYPQYDIHRAGAFPLHLTQPNNQMDPSNPDTWQRAYRFTT
jgi:hypothetical protein